MKQNKKKIKSKLSVLLLLIFTFVIVFLGLLLASVFAVVINCLFCGFSDFTPMICDLPYFVYLIFSLFVAIVLTLRIKGK